FDLDGNLVFTTDGNTAVASRFDAVHRPVEVRRSNGTSARKSWDGWSRLTDHEEVETLFKLSSSYTDAGKVITSATNTLTQEFAWDGAGRTNKAVSKGGATQPVRESQLTYDTAGRLTDSKFGEQGTSSTLDRIYHHLAWIYGSLDLPSQVMSYEDDDAVNYKWMLTHDALGRPTKVENQTTPSFFVKQAFDQLGNVTSIKSPERRGTLGFKHDARGLPTEQELPPVTGGAAAPKTSVDYDNDGILKKYTDATGEPTRVENDGLGRTYKRTYHDDSTEEIFYEGTRVSRFKDRQNRWQSFDYSDRGRLTKVTNGGGLVLDELSYHPDGRLHRWKNADSLVEFENYDAEGRPHLTKQTRLRPDGTVLDSYTQTHDYNGFGQRTNWTMPGSATFGTDNWTTAVQPAYDAAGNIVQLNRVVVNGGTQTLMNADYRAAGRPKNRTLHIGIGTTTATEIGRQYDYGTDGIGRMSAFRVFVGTAPAVLMAGSEVQYEGTKLTSAKLLGLSNGARTSQWRYDDRGRLEKSAPASTQPVLPLTNSNLVDAIVQHLNDADFLKKIERPLAAASGSGGDSKDFKETDKGHKVAKVDETKPTEQTFKYKKADDIAGDPSDDLAGSLRTEDGHFYYSYDEKSRLRKAYLKPLGPAATFYRVSYVYNAAGRMIGRRVEVAPSSGATTPLDVAEALWALATPLQLGPDAGIPASTTFVWDPISDQLVTVFETEKNDGGVTVVGKPIRQYIHGGL
ncbi:MAG TPA: hypothetical protein VN181_14675, partial [Thermoanaerobaculia bacterium]|nr:hypothetical protein [Thermoanaerobaculia bacterium]